LKTPVIQTIRTVRMIARCGFLGFSVRRGKVIDAAGHWTPRLPGSPGGQDHEQHQLAGIEAPTRWPIGAVEPGEGVQP